MDGGIMATANDLNISQAGVVCFDGTATFTGRTITAGSGITVTNGSGVSGNPTISTSGTTNNNLFIARLSSPQANVTGDGTNYTIVFDTVVANQNSVYNNATGIFTAPNTGYYFFNTGVYINGVITEHNAASISYTCSDSTKNAYVSQWNPTTYQQIINPQQALNGSLLVNMTAGDTMKIVVTVTGSTKVVSVNGQLNPPVTWFCGYQIG